MNFSGIISTVNTVLPNPRKLVGGVGMAAVLSSVLAGSKAHSYERYLLQNKDTFCSSSQTQVKGMDLINHGNFSNTSGWSNCSDKELGTLHNEGFFPKNGQWLQFSKITNKNADTNNSQISSLLVKRNDVTFPCKTNLTMADTYKVSGPNKNGTVTLKASTCLNNTSIPPSIMAGESRNSKKSKGSNV